eukprot:5126265-Prymnesium_polylepis.3
MVNKPAVSMTSRSTCQAAPSQPSSGTWQSSGERGNCLLHQREEHRPRDQPQRALLCCPRRRDAAAVATVANGDAAAAAAVRVCYGPTGRGTRTEH